MSTHDLVRPYRLVALDLDATLLNDAGQISPTDAAALAQFAEAGGLVVLASGRMTASIRPYNDAMGVDGPTIGYNGALVRDAMARGSALIHHLPLPASYADPILDYTRAQHFHLNYYYQEVLYTRDDPELRPYAELYSRQTGAVFHFLPDLERFRGCEPTKLILITDPSVPEQFDPRRRDELYAVWEARWGSEVTVMRTNPEYLEFFHRDAGKGHGLAMLTEYYGLSREETLAFGDSYNDISMLEWAGCGIAVENAKSSAKEAADWISPFTNNESAVADALARWWKR